MLTLEECVLNSTSPECHIQNGDVRDLSIVSAFWYLVSGFMILTESVFSQVGKYVKETGVQYSINSSFT